MPENSKKIKSVAGVCLISSDTTDAIKRYFARRLGIWPEQVDIQEVSGSIPLISTKNRRKQ